MKQTFTVLLLVFAVSTSPLHAQSSSSSVATLPEAERAWKNPLSLKNFNFYINALPPPILSGGFGVSALYKVSSTVGLWATQEKEEVSTNVTFDVFGEETKVTSTNTSIGTRFYTSGFEAPGFFGQFGFVWSELQISHRPALFKGVGANKKMYVRGAIVGFGYSWQRPTTPWKIEIGANLEPGRLKKAKYIEEQPGFFGPQKAHLEVSVDYGPVVEGRLGYSF